LYQYFLFDLDGTLTDPGIGITNSVAYALKKFDIEVADKSELFSFIGPPLQNSFQEYYHFTEEQSALAVQYYREYFKDKGIYENMVYDGVAELLAALKREKKTIILATSKPQEFAIRILDYFDLSKYFDSIVGATMDGSRSEKADVIRYALEANKITDLSQALMIGDRKYDIVGANKNDIASVGVLFGYGRRAELEAAGANYIVENPLEIVRFVLPGR
jgi:phosphoglycolate phosphatase